MDNKKQRICPISGKPLPPGSHGNRKIHPDEKIKARDKNNSKRYTKIRYFIKQAKRLDEILEKHYPHSEGLRAIPVQVLINEGFLWNFKTATSLTTNKMEINWILDFGFAIVDKNATQIIIFYGDNPLQHS